MHDAAVLNVIDSASSRIRDRWTWTTVVSYEVVQNDSQGLIIEPKATRGFSKMLHTVISNRSQITLTSKYGVDWVCMDHL